MRLRRVDVRTGGTVSVRSAVVLYAVRTAWRESTRDLLRPIEKRSSERAQAFQAELREIARAHADDPEAQRRAITENSQAHGTNCLTTLAPAVVGVASIQAPALWSPLKQTPPDRLAGLAVIKV